MTRLLKFPEAVALPGAVFPAAVFLSRLTTGCGHPWQGLGCIRWTALGSVHLSAEPSLPLQPAPLKLQGTLPDCSLGLGTCERAWCSPAMKQGPSCSPSPEGSHIPAAGATLALPASLLDVFLLPLWRLHFLPALRTRAPLCVDAEAVGLGVQVLGLPGNTRSLRPGCRSLSPEGITLTPPGPLVLLVRIPLPCPATLGVLLSSAVELSAWTVSLNFAKVWTKNIGGAECSVVSLAAGTCQRIILGHRW